MAVPVVEQESQCNPILSVIVPVLNTRAYLEECLDSLVAQTLEGIEVICVDNGSTDGSYEFLSAYAGKHANVIVVRHPHGRQGGARNVGMEIAGGTYLGFVDSDDFVSPDMFQIMYEAARGGKADAVICNMAYYDDDAGCGVQGLDGDLLDVGEPFSIQQRPRLLRNLTICNKVFSRALIERHRLRFPEGVFHEDQFFVIAALASARRIVTVPEGLYYYRRGRPGSVNESRGRDSLQIFDVMQMVSAFVDDMGVDESLKALVGQVKVLKLLETYRLTGRAYQREYFRRMKEKLQNTEIGADLAILSPSEAREFQVVLRCGYFPYSLFLRLRPAYGKLREMLLDDACCFHRECFSRQMGWQGWTVSSQ